MKSAPPPDPEALAISALLFIAAETETLSRFLALTGLDPGDVRAVVPGAGEDGVFAPEPTLGVFPPGTGNAIYALGIALAVVGFLLARR